MKRITASAGQLSRTSVARSALGALHSLSQCTADVERRAEPPIIEPAISRVAQRMASAIHGRELTLAVATRYVAPDRSTVMTLRQTAFAGSGDTTTSRIRADGSASCAARCAVARAAA